jgi:hypothetical protein
MQETTTLHLEVMAVAVHVNAAKLSAVWSIVIKLYFNMLLLNYLIIYCTYLAKMGKFIALML